MKLRGVRRVKEQKEGTLDNITCLTSMEEGGKQANFVIEVVVENRDVKKIFYQLLQVVIPINNLINFYP
jgi:3-hydroxyacyl-CoA dehydrogenase